MTADGGKHLGAVIPGRVYYIREKISGNYLDVRNSETANGTVYSCARSLDLPRRNGS